MKGKVSAAWNRLKERKAADAAFVPSGHYEHKEAHIVPINWQIMVAKLLLVGPLAVGSMAVLWGHWKMTNPEHPYFDAMRALFAVLEINAVIFTIWTVTMKSTRLKLFAHAVEFVVVGILVVHAAAVLQLTGSLALGKRSVEEATKVQQALIGAQGEADAKQLNGLIRDQTAAEKRGNWQLSSNLKLQINALRNKRATGADGQAIVQAALNNHGKTFFSQEYMETWFFPVPLISGVFCLLVGLTLFSYNAKHEPHSVYKQAMVPQGIVTQPPMQQPMYAPQVQAQSTPQIGFAAAAPPPTNPFTPGRVQADGTVAPDPPKSSRQ